MTVSRRLSELGLILPPAPAPAGAYVPAVRDGDLVWTAGQLPLVDGALALTGLVGRDVTPEQAQELARTCALNALAAIAGLTDLDSIARVVKVVGFVASADGFTGQSGVVNGASTLLADVLGEQGVHARSAVGVASLPLGSPVEIELVARVSADAA